MMKRLFTLLLLLLSIPTFAVDVTWDFRYFTGSVNSNRPIEIEPIRWGALTPSFFTSDRRKYTNDSAGLLTVTNMTTNVAYRVTFYGPFSTLVLTNQFPPGTTGAVYASDYLTATNVIGPQTAYTVAQANARFTQTNSFVGGSNCFLQYGPGTTITINNYAGGGGSTYTNIPGTNAGVIFGGGIGTNMGPAISAANASLSNATIALSYRRPNMTNSSFYLTANANFGTNFGRYSALTTTASGSEMRTAVSGDVLLVGGGTNLTVVSVTNRSIPVTAANLTTPSNIHFIVASGAFFYVMGDGFLSAYQCSAPRSPVLTTNINFGTNSFVKGSIQDGLLIVACSNPGYARIFSVANPALPVLLTTISLGSSQIADAVKRGQYLYIADYGGRTLQVVDIANPLSPFVVNSQAAQDHGDGDTFEPWRVFVRENLLYAMDDGWLQVFSLNNPTNPVFVSASFLQDDVEGSELSGDVMFWSASTGDILAYDMQTTFTTNRIAGTNLGLNGFQLWPAVDDNYIYAPLTNSVQILNRAKLPRLSPFASTLLVGITNSVRLPIASNNVNRALSVKAVSNITNIVSVIGSETIDGASSVTLTNGQILTVISDGTNWITTAKPPDLSGLIINENGASGLSAYPTRVVIGDTVNTASLGFLDDANVATNFIDFSDGMFTLHGELTSSGGFDGSGSGLTGLPAAQLTGTLPVLNANSLTNISPQSLAVSTNNVKGSTNWVLVIQGTNSFWTNVVPQSLLNPNCLTNSYAGTITATAFSGSGTALTGIPTNNASALTTGALAQGLLPSTVATNIGGNPLVLPSVNIYTTGAAVYFSNTVNNAGADTFAGSYQLMSGGQFAARGGSLNTVGNGTITNLTVTGSNLVGQVLIGNGVVSGVSNLIATNAVFPGRINSTGTNLFSGTTIMNGVTITNAGASATASISVSTDLIISPPASQSINMASGSLNVNSASGLVKVAGGGNLVVTNQGGTFANTLTASNVTTLGFTSTATNTLTFTAVSSCTNTLPQGNGTASLSAGTAVILQDRFGNTVDTIGLIGTVHTTIPMPSGYRLSGTSISCVIY